MPIIVGTACKPLRQFATAPHDDADQVALAGEKQGIGAKDTEGRRIPASEIA